MTSASWQEVEKCREARLPDAPLRVGTDEDEGKCKATVINTTVSNVPFMVISIFIF